MSRFAEARPVTERVPLLELAGVRAGYGAIEVLRGVDLALPEGAVVALLGPNGAGKSTTVKVCAGLLPLSTGELRVGGRRVNGISADVLARAGVCTIPEGRGVFPNLTVRDNLRMMTQCGVSIQQVEEVAYSRFRRLGERRHQLAGTLSGGEQQMLAMARALAVDPAVLLLDELSMGLGPLIVEELYGLVAKVAEEGVSILVIEQFARAVLGIADVAAIMLNGRIVATGPPHDIEAQLQSAYLGGQQ